MVCPHCKQEVEGYATFKPVAPLNLNLAAGPAQVAPWIINSVCADQPISFGQGVHLNFNANGCAGGQAPIMHYCIP